MSDGAAYLGHVLRLQRRRARWKEQRAVEPAQTAARLLRKTPTSASDENGSDRLHRAAVLCAAAEKTGINRRSRQADGTFARPALREERAGGGDRQEGRRRMRKIMDGTEVCFAKIIDLDEARRSTTHVARKNLRGGRSNQPAPAPRSPDTREDPGEPVGIGARTRGPDRLGLYRSWRSPRCHRRPGQFLNSGVHGGFRASHRGDAGGRRAPRPSKRRDLMERHAHRAARHHKGAGRLLWRREVDDPKSFLDRHGGCRACPGRAARRDTGAPQNPRAKPGGIAGRRPYAISVVWWPRVEPSARPGQVDTPGHDDQLLNSTRG